MTVTWNVKPNRKPDICVCRNRLFSENISILKFYPSRPQILNSNGKRKPHCKLYKLVISLWPRCPWPSFFPNGWKIKIRSLRFTRDSSFTAKFALFHMSLHRGENYQFRRQPTNRWRSDIGSVIGNVTSWPVTPILIQYQLIKLHMRWYPVHFTTYELPSWKQFSNWVNPW